MLVALFALGLQLGTQGIEFGHALLQLAQAIGGDVVGLVADVPLHRLVGLGGGLVLVDECAAHRDLLLLKTA
ncbi:hypothetical protein D3C79_1007100 [compost metagenome]